MKLDANEARERDRRLRMFRLQQLPKVRQASTQLQDIMGIESGTRMLEDGQEVKLWKIPARPKTFMELVIEMQQGQVQGAGVAGAGNGVGIPEIRVDNPDAAKTRLKDSASAEPQRGNPTGKRPLPNLKRPREDSPQKANLRARRVGPDSNIAGTQEQKKPSLTIITDRREVVKKRPVQPLASDQVTRLGDSADASTDCIPNELRQNSLQPRPKSSNTHFRPIPPDAIRASPPTRWVNKQDPAGADELPITWDWLLSQQVCEWLEDPTTISQQIHLTDVKFHDIDPEILPQWFDSNSGRKLKVTRMIISNDADTERKLNPSGKGGPEILDWFVIENRAVLSDDPESYWLVAFPVMSVTGVTKRAEVDGREQRLTEWTVWSLREKHRVPLVHGRGIPECLLENFTKACIAGEGKIEIGASGPLW